MIAITIPALTPLRSVSAGCASREGDLLAIAHLAVKPGASQGFSAPP